MTRSQQFPSINGGASYSALQIPSSLAGNNSDGTPATSFFYRGGGPSASAAWNLDFWGLYHGRQSEAARADLLASEMGPARDAGSSGAECCRCVLSTSQLLDAQLEITQNTIKARTDSLKLTQSLGAARRRLLADADTRQAEELLRAAQANLPDLRRQIAIQENNISILLEP